jgi:hypothetical protein
MRRSRKLTILAAMAGCVAFLPCQATGDNAETSLSRDVDNPALQPVRFRVQCSIPAASLGCNADAPVVPSGKRMVIEQVSVDAAADSGVSGLPRPACLESSSSPETRWTPSSKYRRSLRKPPSSIRLKLSSATRAG